MISIISACSRNRVIGIDNNLPWNLSEDLKRFKKITTGKKVVMGRKTFESIGRPLPNRTNIVISRKTDWFEEGILIVGSIKEAIKFAKKIDEKIFIIGGGNIYEQTIDLVDQLEITWVDATLEADTYFPKIDEKNWRKTDEICHEKDEKNQFNFCFQTFERISEK